MSDEEAPPEPTANVDTTGPLPTVESNGERLRTLLRMAFAVSLAVLLVATVALFSLYETLKSQTESQERRIERLNNMMGDLLVANENAEKIEKIEQQVNGIQDQVTDLTDVIKAQDAKALEAELETEPKKKKRR